MIAHHRRPGTLTPPLRPQALLPFFPLVLLVHSIRVADIDHDGRPDLGVSLEGTKAAGFHGKGDGSFEAPVLINVGGGTIVPANLDQDSLPDLVSPSGFGLVAG